MWNTECFLSKPGASTCCFVKPRGEPERWEHLDPRSPSLRGSGMLQWEVCMRRGAKLGEMGGALAIWGQQQDGRREGQADCFKLSPAETACHSLVQRNKCCSFPALVMGAELLPSDRFWWDAPEDAEWWAALHLCSSLKHCRQIQLYKCFLSAEKFGYEFSKGCSVRLETFLEILDSVLWELFITAEGGGTPHFL